MLIPPLHFRARGHLSRPRKTLAAPLFFFHLTPKICLRGDVILEASLRPGGGARFCCNVSARRLQAERFEGARPMSKKGRVAAGEAESKRELQRQMEEARERVSETVAEIKSVVTHQYDEVKETVETVKESFGEVLDWRAEFERNPLVWGAGAVSIGILIGFGIAHAFDEKDSHARRSKKSPGKGENIVAELSGFADVVLPTISAKVRELFGLDLDTYLRAAHEKKKPARKRITGASATKRGAKKTVKAKVKAKGKR